jgi:hypothetical protein
MVYGKEVGASGTPHLQGYIYLATPRVFNTVKQLLPDGAHIEKAKGSVSQNIEYCTKDGDYNEIGERPLSAKRKGELEKDRWKRIKTLAQNNELESIEDKVFVQNYRGLKEIARDYMKPVADLNGVCGEWIYGPAGIGKSRLAREKAGTVFYSKNCNKWWDGYQNEEVVIIDDIDKSHSVLGHHLKIWLDRYAFIAETKGGAVRIRPKKIYITSQYKVEDIWEDEYTVAAIRRRCNIIHLVGWNSEGGVFE